MYDGGLAIYFDYNDFNQLLHEVAECIGKSIAGLGDISKSGWYPDLIQNINSNKGGKKLMRPNK
ncbi:hypothetical protein ACFQZE_10260 [Paenibacillus sp. GCM10027627]|uniref:hypothetical protein n=1 Tax=unclassified Paenibacillus TaxID=185978 RepID=UPI00363FF5F8